MPPLVAAREARHTATVWEHLEPGDLFVIEYRDGADDGRPIPWATRFVSWDGSILALYHRFPVGVEGTFVMRIADRSVTGNSSRIEWPYAHCLSLLRPCDAHVIGHEWDIDWTFQGWRIGLQSPLRPTPSGLQTTEWPSLDFIVQPDGSYAWQGDNPHNDADYLLSKEQLRAAATEAARIKAAPPWPTGWESWRPATDWPPLSLPEEWRRADSDV